MSNRYMYLIAYQFNGGSGRTFYERETPIDSVEVVQAIEEDIRKRNPDLGTLHVDNIVLLREWSE
jgi:radical SAM superfamily enzyme with C-terminal helix-hairpin-helix motif